MRIDSRAGAGTSVRIYLPRAEQRLPERQSAPTRPGAAEALRGATILLVDDDNDVREVTRAMLHDLGYLVLEAGSGGAALAVLDREAKIDLLVVDFAMPGMNGAEVARLAQSKRPKLPVIFVTGFADRAGLAGIDDAGIVGKPFAIDEFALKVRIALANGRQQKVVPLRR